MPAHRRLRALERHTRAATAPTAAAGQPTAAAFATARPRRRLTADELLRFHSDGLLVMRNLLSPPEIAALSQRVDAIASGRTAVPERCIQPDPPDVATPPEEGVTATTGVRKLYDLTLHDEEMLAHARRPQIVDVIEDLLGTPHIKLCATHPCYPPPA